MSVIEQRPVVHTAPRRVVVAPPPRRRGIGMSGRLMLLPMLVVFGLFSWYPIVRAITMSFQSTNLIDPPTWVGFANYTGVLHDPLLPIAVKNTLIFAGLALVFGYPVPLLLAVVMSEVRKRKGIFTALAYLPVVVPPVVSVLLWKVFYDGSPDGVFNKVLSWFGLGPYPWLFSSTMAMPSLVLEATWAAAGGTVIIYLAALSAVPSELYDAAEIDGASIWRKLRHVTLPQLRGVMLITLILQLIGTAQVFLEPYLLTGGGPSNATTTVLLLIYNYAFGTSVGGDFGQATALSVMLALTLALLSGLYFRVTRNWSTS